MLRLVTGATPPACCRHRMKLKKNRWSRAASGRVPPGPALEVIARLAELMWEKEGCPEGRDIEFWLRAEAELKEIEEPNQFEARP
jgi:hypothetical protein